MGAWHFRTHGLVNVFIPQHICNNTMGTQPNGNMKCCEFRSQREPSQDTIGFNMDMDEGAEDAACMPGDEWVKVRNLKYLHGERLRSF